MELTLDNLCQLAADNRDGCGWYSAAAEELRCICKMEHWQVSHFAGIVAVTSPRVAVRRNLRIALQYRGTGRYLANVLRNVRTSVRTWETSGEILGQKTSAFYRALLDDPSAVVLDTHMANLFQVDPGQFRRKAYRNYWGRIVRRVALLVRMTPADAQACLWFGHKRNIGEYPEAMPVLHEYKHWLSYNREFPAAGVLGFDSESVENDTF